MEELGSWIVIAGPQRSDEIGDKMNEWSMTSSRFFIMPQTMSFSNNAASAIFGVRHHKYFLKLSSEIRLLLKTEKQGRKKEKKGNEGAIYKRQNHSWQRIMRVLLLRLWKVIHLYLTVIAKLLKGTLMGKLQAYSFSNHISQFYFQNFF